MDLNEEVKLGHSKLPQSGAQILGEEYRGGMMEFGLVPKDQKKKKKKSERGKRGVIKTCRKTEDEDCSRPQHAHKSLTYIAILLLPYSLCL